MKTLSHNKQIIVISKKSYSCLSNRFLRLSRTFIIIIVVLLTMVMATGEVVVAFSNPSPVILQQSSINNFHSILIKSHPHQPMKIKTLDLSMSKESNGNDESIISTTNRRSFLVMGLVIPALSSLPSITFAAYGKGANQAMPGFVPSPIRPTGELAKTCAVVAMGREDICLSPLKPPGLYEKNLLQKKLDSLSGSNGDADNVTNVEKMIRSVMNAEWEICGVEVKLQKERNSLPRGALKELGEACSSGEGSLATKAVLKLTERF